MQKYSVEIAPAALEEIEKIALFIAEDSIENALRWSSLIEKKILSLDLQPARCPLA